MNRRRWLRGVACGSLAGLAGCVAVPTEADEPSARSLVESALETIESVDDVSLRQTVTVETDSSSVERVSRVVRRPPIDRRLEVLESTDDVAPAGAISVRTQTVTTEYDPLEDQVVERHHPNRLLVDYHRLGLEALFDHPVLEYAGTESVDGREAHVVRARSSDESDLSVDLLVGETVYRIPLDPTQVADLEEPIVERRVWIDDATRYPVRERTDVRDGETRVGHLEVTAEDFAVDEGVDDETFTLEPPAGATVETVGREPTGIYDERAVAAEAVAYDLPDPDVPVPYALDRIVVLEKREELGTSTTFWYADRDRPDREVFVTVRDERRYDADALEAEPFDDVDGYRRDGRIQSLFWSCDGLHYEVSSAHDPDLVREVARSIGCPEDRPVQQRLEGVALPLVACF
ncbi:LolA family protein [Natrarchaeobaculum aegyptiacum]|uniref:DUF2092 domain-containing protein n=1 Tax=Natrarchaeobaculum aegyptiacum TaxID=745377 RepID=A0A2Z2HWU9_9EURY|nr:DUF2092 domain-containing protein [Natrarchaeobaculum aegyptiacum]ARS91343.1 hypothetical protein B1756_17525 [Natrarchaeobaculum aegyptiacum]